MNRDQIRPHVTMCMKFQPALWKLQPKSYCKMRSVPGSGTYIGYMTAQYVKCKTEKLGHEKLVTTCMEQLTLNSRYYQTRIYYLSLEVCHNYMNQEKTTPKFIRLVRNLRFCQTAQYPALSRRIFNTTDIVIIECLICNPASMAIKLQITRSIAVI